MKPPTKLSGAPLFRVSFVRPYEESVRTKVEASLLRAGASVGEVFREPLDLAQIERYFRGRGIDDQLVIPFHATGAVTGIDLIERFLPCARPRRALMPVKIAGASVVQGLLRERLGDEAASRVLVMPVSDIESRERELREHFVGDSR